MQSAPRPAPAPHPRHACALRPPAGERQSTAASQPARTRPCLRAAPRRSNAHFNPVTRGRPLFNQQNSFSSGNAVEPVRRARLGRRRPGRRPARLPTRAGAQPPKLGREPAHGEPSREPPGVRAAAGRPREEVTKHDRVRPGAVVGARRRDRRQTRLQNQSAAGQDQHVHQDTGARRGARVRGDRAQGGRRARQARDPLRRRALLADPRIAQVRRRAAAAGRRARTRHRAGARALPRRGPRRRPQGRHHQAHPAHDAHLHRHTFPRAGARLRGHRPPRERRGRPQGDRGAHRATHRRRRRPSRHHARRGQRAARAAVPRRARLAAAAPRTGSRLLVGGLVLVRRVVGAAGRPARHLVVDGARRGPGRVAVVRVAGRRRRGGRVGVGRHAAVAGGVAGARVRGVRRARRGGGAGAVRTQPVLPGVRAAAGGGGRAVPRLLGARAPGHPHPLVGCYLGSCTDAGAETGATARHRWFYRARFVIGIDLFYLKIVIKIFKKNKNRVIEILVPKVGASPARPVRRAEPTYRKSAELFTIYFLIMNVFY